MRRAFAVLALLVTSWPHVVVLECALGSTSPTSVEQGHAHHGTPAHTAGTGHDHATPHASDAPADGVPCAMVMACGLVMMEARATTAIAEAVGGADREVRAAPRTPVNAELAAEPPPPRRSA